VGGCTVGSAITPPNLKSPPHLRLPPNTKQPPPHRGGDPGDPDDNPDSNLDFELDPKANPGMGSWVWVAARKVLESSSKSRLEFE